MEQLEQRLALTAGSLDTTFNLDGVLVEDLGLSANDEIYSSAVQSDGKIVVAGLVSTDNQSLIVRYNSDGTRDTSFGTGGYTLIPQTGGIRYTRIDDVAIDPLGRIVAVGTSTDLTTTGFSVIRVTSTGQLDASFSGDGLVRTVLENSTGTVVGSNATAVGLQSDGKIVVGGTLNTPSGPTDRDFAVACYNDDGSLDTTFGTDGYVITDFAGGQDQLTDLAIQSDGKIVAVGNAETIGASDDFGVVRYNADGSLDATFDGDGKVMTNFVPTAFTSQDIANSVALEDDGRIVVAGYSGVAYTSTTTALYDFAAARYNPDGSLDTTFGASSPVAGTLRVDAGANDRGTDVVIQSDGKYIVGGHDLTSAGAGFELVRLLATGQLDTTFSGDGKVATKFSDFGYTATVTRLGGLNIQPDGMILAAGWLNISSGTRDIAITRYESGLLAADAGGPYAINEPGGSVLLDASGSAGSGTLTYEWDLDGDNVFEVSGPTAVFSATDVDGPATITVSLRVSNGIDPDAYDTAVINVLNVAPTADAGGSYTVSEGGTVTLSGSGTDVAGVADPLTFAWDLDGDSVYETAGASPVFDASALDGPTSVTVSLKVTDGDGGEAIDTATITVLNVAPTASAGGSYTVNEGGTVTLSGSGTDIAADPLTFAWDLDGDSVYETTGANPVFDASALDGPMSVTVSLKVTDGDGGEVIDTATIDVLNVAPTANAGGSYTVSEGGTVTLNGSGTDVAADPLTFAWDLDGDSVYETTGANPVFDASALDGPTSVTVSLKVTDGDGGEAIDTATIDVLNVAPTANAGGTYLTFDDTPITLTGTGTDVAADALTFEWDLDGDSVFETSGASVTFDPVALGLSGVTVAVSLRVSDGDGGFAIDTADVTVLATGTLLIDDTLVIVGSNSCDVVFIYRWCSQIVVYATFNDDNPVVLNVADVAAIDVRVRGGNDVVVISPTVNIATTIDGGSGHDALLGGGGRDVIYGGSGNDMLAGQGGDDVLFGGTGADDLFGGGGDDVIVAGDQDDVVYGGSGRDLLIGGLDSDWIDGGAGDDVLIGGTTIHDNDLAALDAVMAIWTSSASFNNRVNELTQSGGLLESGVAVFDDDDCDVLIGGAGRDLLFADLYFWDGSIDFLSFQHCYDHLEPVS
jgi:uncharacterized delta-60 repeat protein